MALFVSMLVAGLATNYIGRNLLPFVGGLVALAVAADFIRRGLNPRRTAMWVLALFAVLAFPLLWQSPTTAYGTEKVTLLFTSTLLSALAATLFRRRSDVERFLSWWPLVAAAIAVLVLAGPTHESRAVALDANPIWLARPIGSALVVVIWAMVHRRIARRRAIVLGVVLLAGLLATGSRGPFIATIAGGLVAVDVWRGKRRTGRRLFLAISSITVVLILLLAPPSEETRIGGFLADPAAAVAGSSRSELFDVTADLIATRPMGVGYGHWSREVSADPFVYPHNLWLEVLAEAGWVVGGVLIAAVISVLRRLWKLARRDALAHAVLALLVVECLNVSVSGDVNARSFFAMLALGVATSRRRKEEAPSLPVAVEATGRRSLIRVP